MAHEHDSRYKMLFSNPLMVRRLIESFVDEPFLTNEQIIAVEPVEKETIGIDFSQRRSDVLWKLRTTSAELYVYVLIEFQSTVEGDTPFRILEYVVRLYRLLLGLSDTNTVPSIFPVLLYNGDAEWNVPLSTQEMHAEPMPPDYFPHFSYYPIIINQIPDGRLKRIKNAVSAVFLVENTDPQKLPETMDALVDILKEEMPQLRRHFSRWFQRYMASYDVPFGVDDIEKRIAETESMFGTKLERYKEELKQEGRQQSLLSLARRLLERGDSVEAVAEVTELPLEHIQTLADELSDRE